MESEDVNVLEYVNKLCKEVQKVDEELEVVEAVAARKEKAVQEATKQRDNLLQEVDAMESRKRSVLHQLKKVQEGKAAAQDRIKRASKKLAELCHEEALVKEDTARTNAVADVTQRRIKAWEIIQQQQQGATPEEVALARARQKVDSLRKRCRALSHVPHTLLGLRSQVAEAKQRCVQLEQQAIEKNKALKSSENEVNRVNHDVRVFQRRKKDHEARLKLDIEQVSGHNARLAEELSELELEVTKMRETSDK